MRLRNILILFIVLIIFALSITACAPPQGETAPPSSDNATQPPTGVTPPPVTDTDRGNPKLEYVLVQLIQAEKRGEAESFARQSEINLVDGKVDVFILCVPGQTETVAKEATNVGAKEVRMQSENDWVTAMVPITSLTILANKKSVGFIGIPVPPTLAQ